MTIRRLDGWWRLFIVLVAVHACLVGIYAWTVWPDVSQIKISLALINELSPKALEASQRINIAVPTRHVTVANGDGFEVAGDLTPEQVNLVIAEFNRALNAELSERRLKLAQKCLLLWLIPSAFVCALGFALAWVRRGFSSKNDDRGANPN